MDNLILTYGLNESELTILKSALSNLAIVEEFTPENQNRDIKVPCFFVLKVESYGSLQKLLSYGVLEEKIVLLGTMADLNDQKLSLQRSIIDWIPQLGSVEELRLKFQWYMVKEFGPGAEKKDFRSLQNIDQIKLTRKEEQILHCIATNRSATRDQIFKSVWKNQNVTKKTIDVHLFNLRKKLRIINRDIVSLDNGILQVS